MCTTVTLRNIIGETVKIFLETVIPLQRHFNTDPVFFTLADKVEWLLVNRGFIFIQIFYECADAAFIFEVILLIGAFVDQSDRDTGI